MMKVISGIEPYGTWHVFQGVTVHDSTGVGYLMEASYVNAPPRL